MYRSFDGRCAWRRTTVDQIPWLAYIKASWKSSELRQLYSRLTTILLLTIAGSLSLSPWTFRESLTSCAYSCGKLPCSVVLFLFLFLFRFLCPLRECGSMDCFMLLLINLLLSLPFAETHIFYCLSNHMKYQLSAR